MTEKIHPPTYYLAVTDNHRWGKAGNLPEAIENATDLAYPAKGEPPPWQWGDDFEWDREDWLCYESEPATKLLIYIIPEVLWEDFRVGGIDGGVTLIPNLRMQEEFSEPERRQIMQGCTLYATWKNGRVKFYPDMEALKKAPV